MVLLVGNEATETVASTVVTKKAATYRFVAGHSGTVNTIKLMTNGIANTGVTEVRFQIYDESAEQPGLVLAHVEGGENDAVASGEPAINTYIEAAFDKGGITVTAGTAYWLVVVPVGGTLHWNHEKGSAGTSNRRQSSVAMTGSISATAWSWNAATVPGPAQFAATGTEAGGATVTLNAAASTSAATLAAQATTAVLLAAAASASAGTLSATAATTLPLTPAASTSQAALSVTAGTVVLLTPAVASSSGACTVATPSGGAALPLAPASSTSTATLAVKAATIVALSAAGSASTASLAISAATQLPLAPAISLSNTANALTASTTVPFASASSTSTAACTITIGATTFPADVKIVNHKAAVVAIVNHKAGRVKVVGP